MQRLRRGARLAADDLPAVPRARAGALPAGLLHRRAHLRAVPRHRQGHRQAVRRPAAATAASRSERKMTVKIPAGHRDRPAAAAQGEGEAGTRGGPAGRSLRRRPRAGARVLPARRQRPVLRDPGELHDAGARRRDQVPTLDDRGDVKIPEGTQTGTTFRLRGKGMPDVNGRGRGDLRHRAGADAEEADEGAAQLLEQLAKGCRRRSSSRKPAGRGRAQPLRPRQGHVRVGSRGSEGSRARRNSRDGAPALDLHFLDATVRPISSPSRSTISPLLAIHETETRGRVAWRVLLFHVADRDAALNASRSARSRCRARDRGSGRTRTRTGPRDLRRRSDQSASDASSLRRHGIVQRLPTIHSSRRPIGTASSSSALRWGSAPAITRPRACASGCCRSRAGGPKRARRGHGVGRARARRGRPRGGVLSRDHSIRMRSSARARTGSSTDAGPRVRFEICGFVRSGAAADVVLANLTGALLRRIAHQ